ncbi:hypothetical protein [Neobacillus thermocopriae]|uniref:hypothetical protein n=1 Tax=Neobacillus thermocopriae TaxID=1215031 RepID=UPI00376FEB42
MSEHSVNEFFVGILKLIETNGFGKTNSTDWGKNSDECCTHYIWHHSYMAIIGFQLGTKEASFYSKEDGKPHLARRI